ncbi:hypothetical protein B7C42_07370 [Nocardia cerradoensis]|uniref:Uncharacterized protein n=1 Tax=Nocardia cerradoensis TaxID=85688 RepID=A0A231GVQ5_9NOCA|nr:hypothetical protein [Nocardia cerradoensis]OXR40561.1 hypothetical protein B7C42_07370 [Nocardia cerradoensis]
MAEPGAHDEAEWMDYSEFGERFVVHAVNRDRIEAAVSGMAGRGMSIGPFSIGPAGLAGLVAEGKVGKPVIARSEPHVTFEVRVPVSMHLTVTLGGQQFRIEATVEIDLTLHARTADPLLIVIDIPRVRSRDVSFAVRAEAVGAAVDVLLDPIATLVQREVASRLNAMLADPAARRGRVFDIEAIMNGTRSEHVLRTDFEWIEYAEFGRRFFPLIVTPDRVRDVVEGLAGRAVEVGPLRTGPGDAATVEVQGAVRMPRLARREGDHPVSFDLTIPVGLDITVDVLKANRYRAEVEVGLLLVARAAEPLLIVIDVTPPRSADVAVELQAEGWRAKMLGSVGKIRRQIAAQVAQVIRAELADPRGRTIDVAGRIDAATS